MLLFMGPMMGATHFVEPIVPIEARTHQYGERRRFPECQAYLDQQLASKGSDRRTGQLDPLTGEPHRHNPTTGRDLVPDHGRLTEALGPERAQTAVR